MMKITTSSESETLRLAEKIGSRLFPGAILLLSGGLGAGKTVFVRGLANGLDVTGLVKSPTYNIINIYEGEIPLIHFDLYRINGSDEFYSIGGDEYLGGSNICAIEWPVNAEDVFTGSHLAITINDKGADMREIIIEPCGEMYETWFEKAKNDIDG